VHETPDDLAALQELLDASYAAAGEHLRRIITPERRLTAEQVAAALTGMRLLALATVTADGRPIVGPVDGVFLRGSFHFGSSPDSVRFRHIRARPDVSATHMEGEPFAVTVHGRAHIHDLRKPEAAGFREALVEVYAPRYGDEWIGWAEKHPYARIDARRMYTFVY
jgi:uncharacterized pyridoxamine 5'-phosphate oxidase family protein